MKQASAERCRQQAELHRKMAEAADAPEMKAKLLSIARSYDELAQNIVKTTSRFY
jgi:hypothetical protein